MKKILSVLVALFVSFQLNAQEGIPIVSKWIDQRGNSNDASQTETARQSFLLHNAHNNKPLLHFDGVKLQSQFQLKRNKFRN